MATEAQRHREETGHEDTKAQSTGFTAEGRGAKKGESRSLDSLRSLGMTSKAKRRSRGPGQVVPREG